MLAVPGPGERTPSSLLSPIVFMDDLGKKCLSNPWKTPVSYFDHQTLFVLLRSLSS